jgi:hypothetical protein
MNRGCEVGCNLRLLLGHGRSLQQAGGPVGHQPHPNVMSALHIKEEEREDGYMQAGLRVPYYYCC